MQRWFAENGVEYLRAYPSAVLGDEPEELFARAADNWRPESWLAQMGGCERSGTKAGCSSRSVAPRGRIQSAITNGWAPPFQY